MRLYFTIVGIYLVFCTSLLIILGQIEAQLWLNQFHSSFSDVFFEYATYLGNGWFGIFLLPFFLCFAKVRTVLLGVLACGLAGLFSQIAKRFIFGDFPRPTAVIPVSELHLTGVNQLLHYSFPSGHNTFIFALMTFLAFIAKKSKLAQVFFALSAILVGYSRVYLEQHWVKDSLVGAFLGMFTFLMVLYCMSFISKNWGQKTLPQMLIKR